VPYGKRKEVNQRLLYGGK